MKTIALALAAGTLFLAGCCTTHQSKQWEYRTVINGTDDQLNQLVQQGWKVESFSVGSPSGGGVSPSYLLKRQKQ